MAVCPRAPGAAERQIADGAQMIFELTGHATLDGPVSRVVDSRRHLIGDQAIPCTTKNSMVKHADVVERVHDAFQIQSARAARAAHSIKRRNAVAQNAAPVRIGRTTDRTPSVRRAERAPTMRNLAREFLKFLIDQARFRRSPPKPASMSRRAAQHELSFAVIAQAPRLQHAGKPDVSDRADQFLAAVDRGMRGDRDFEAWKTALFPPADLATLRAPLAAGGLCVIFSRGSRALPGNVFPVEGHDIAARRQFGEQRRVLKIADQDGRDLRARRVGAAIEKQAAHAQWGTRQAPACAPTGRLRRCRRASISRGRADPAWRAPPRFAPARNASKAARMSACFIGENRGGEQAPHSSRRRCRWQRWRPARRSASARSTAMNRCRSTPWIGWERRAREARFWLPSFPADARRRPRRQ